jgi:RimJ/RimL family protein N-acetyltransferase
MPGLPRLAEPLTDGHVSLREWTPADVPTMAANLDDPAIARWTRVPSPYTREHAEAYMAELEERRVAGSEHSLAVVAADDGDVVGALNLRITSREHRRAEIATAFFAHGRGRGLAHRAGRLLARYAFDEIGIARLEAVVAADNDAVQRATARAGFARETTLRSYVEQGDRRIDMVVWSLLPGDP